MTTPDEALAPTGLEWRLDRIRKPAGIAMALLSIAYFYSVFAAPIDATQGVIQKILYVHPPLAYGAYLGFVVTGIVAGGLYLWKAQRGATTSWPSPVQRSG